MRYIRLICTMIAGFLGVFTYNGTAQQINPVPDYIFRNQMSVGRNAPTDTAAYLSVGPRFGAVKGFMPPMVVDTNAVTGVKRNGLLIFSVQLNNFAYWDSTTSRFRQITATPIIDSLVWSTRAWRQKAVDSLLPLISAASNDTLLLSTRAWRQKGDDSVSALVAAKLNISDTATMLGAYLRKGDTASMLTPYVRIAGVGLTKGTQTLSADTVLLATRAWKQKGDDSLGAIIATKGSGTVTSVGSGFGTNFSAITSTGSVVVDSLVMTSRASRDKLKDSLQANINAKGSGTVTSVSAGTGMSFTTITSSGAVNADTVALATRVRVQKAVDSLGSVKQNTLTNPVTGTGTTNYVSKITGTSAIGNSTIQDDGLNIGIGKNPNSGTGYRYFDLQGKSSTQSARFEFYTNTPTRTGFIQSDINFGVLIAGDSTFPVTINTNAKERMRVTAAGNVGIGTSSPPNFSASATHFEVSGQASGGYGSIYASNFGKTSIGFIYANATETGIGSQTNHPVRILTNNNTKATFTAAGRFLLGTNTEDTFKLDINGNIRSTGGALFATTYGRVSIGGSASIVSKFQVNADNTDSLSARFIHNKEQGGINVSNGGSLASNRNVSIFLSNGSTLNGADDRTYQIFNIASSSTASDFGVQYWNGSTYSERFRLTSAGNFGLLAFDPQEALDINGRLRIRNSSAPSAKSDSYIAYSADITAGNAAPHFLLENGVTIKLYQETTSVGSASLVSGGGTALTDTDTFDGYTLAKVVKALRNLGILQ